MNEITVSTPNGNQSFVGVKCSYHNFYYEIITTTNDKIKCTENHIFETLNGGVLAKDITKKDELIHSQYGNCFIKSKRKIRKKVKMFDLVGVEGGSIYYTNDIASHNCDFLGSSNTLLSNSSMNKLAIHEALTETENMKVYAQPKKGHAYVATIDVSGGIGADYSVINIMDVTEYPHEQVLVYRNNEIDPTKFASVIKSIGYKYNKATVIVELNNDGKLTAKELFELEYENLISTASIKGDNVIKGGRNSSVGILMTTNTKKIGCARLSDLIETEMVLIKDEDTIREFSTFVVKGNSYSADVGKNDDCVMTLVMFAWFTTTNYFEDISGANSWELLQKAKDDDDLHTLLGFIGGDSNEDDFDTEFQASYW